MPIIMVVANKSAPLLLGVAALLANLAVVAAGSGKPLLRRYLHLAISPYGLLIGAVIAMDVLSLAWTVDPAMTSRGLIEALPEAVFAWALASAWPLSRCNGDVRALSIGLALAALLIIFESTAGMPLRHLAGVRTQPYDLKWSALALVLLVWPAVDDSLHRRERALPIAVITLVGIAAILAHSSTSAVALALSVLMFLLAGRVPRTALYGTAAIFMALLAVGPWIGVTADRAISTPAREALSDQHASNRIEIWTQFGQRARERLFLGHGFNSSFSVGEVTRGEQVIANSYPHNLPLQIWIELGLVGAVCAGLILAYVVFRMGKLLPALLPARLAHFVAMAVAILVFTNVWRPWWLAVVSLALIILGQQRKPAASSLTFHVVDGPTVRPGSIETAG